MAALLITLPALVAAQADRPVVGAIRWDAWYSDQGPVKEVERSLGQPKYHFRLPWFARVEGPDRVRINGDTAAIMAREIAYAAEAGLDYWAFLDYGPGNEMTRALDRYLAAGDKSGIQYCFIEEGARLDERGAKDWARVIGHFQNPHYLKVLGGRPLLFVFGPPAKQGNELFGELAGQTVATGLQRPYVVMLGGNAALDRVTFGADAVSEYGTGKGYGSDHWSYGELTREMRRKFWETWKRERIPFVTFCSAGWDPRPRHERPPSWCRWITPAPDPTPAERQKPLIDEVTAEPEQLAGHLREAVDFTRANPELNPAQLILIYGWNENDEGGWLIPTLNPDGTANEERIKAVGRVLR